MVYLQQRQVTALHWSHGGGNAALVYVLGLLNLFSGSTLHYRVLCAHLMGLMLVPFTSVAHFWVEKADSLCVCQQYSH